MSHNGFDLIDGQAIFLHGCLQSVSGRVGVTARRVKFERCLDQRPTHPEPINQFTGIRILAHAGTHALGAFKNALCTREASLRQIGRLNTCANGMSRVQLLGISRIT